MQFIKDYEFAFQYHPGKANVVADALSTKPRRRLSALRCSLFRDLVTLSEYDWHQETSSSSVYLGALQVHSSWGSRVVDAQASDFWVQTRKGVILKEPHPDWTVGPDGGLG